MTSPRVVENVTCLGCGCACDDIAVVVSDERIVETRNACPLGRAWFGDGRVPACARADGRDTSIESAVVAAAAMLRGASRPLVYLAPDVSCEAQREAGALADVLGARLDTVTSATALPVVLSGQERGFASATLGEIRNRADVVVFWAVDLEHRYPRFTSRYAPDPVGIHVPDGRRSRTVVAVDVGAATASANADQRVVIGAVDEIATLTALTTLAHPAGRLPGDIVSPAGPAWDAARALAPTLLSARYVALVHDAEPDDRAARSSLRFDALTALAQTLNERTRCAAIGLRGGGNRSGAEAVLTAQTGYPVAVDFAAGYPRYVPHEGSAAASLARGDVDVAIVIGDAAQLPERVAEALERVPRIVVGPRASGATLGMTASIAIDTGTPGIHSPGTAVRADDVPLPLRPSLTGPPSAEELLRTLVRSVLTGAAGAAEVVVA